MECNDKQLGVYNFVIITNRLLIIRWLEMVQKSFKKIVSLRDWIEIPFFRSVMKRRRILDDYTNLMLRGSSNKFPDFFRMGTFIDITHMKLKSPTK